mmetsp:Transcript_14527/g.41766  ORF Transcript_14527/g.41766 Transcript_14527/m.41766 type:complete len:490 (+) Transcript_14527:97-1566(+)
MGGADLELGLGEVVSAKKCRHRWRTATFLAGLVVTLAVLHRSSSSGAYSVVVWLPIACVLALAVSVLARLRRSSASPPPSSLRRPPSGCQLLRRAKTTPAGLDAVGADVQPWPQPWERQRHVRFNSWVSCLYVRDLTGLPRPRKSEIWWQQDDFDAFLSTRVEIARAYRAAARKLGLELAQLSSMSTHGDEGYRAMIGINAKLCGESRRGLGFGRSRQRAKNRDAYIAAVLSEQRRQRRAAAADDRGGAAVKLDAEAIARVARRVSARDRLYAHWLAETYYRQDREAEAETSELQQKGNPLGSIVSSTEGDLPLMVVGSPALTPRKPPLTVEESDAPLRLDSDVSGDDDVGVQDICDMSINDEVGGRGHWSQVYTKGFGLSVDRLREVGLGANGHNISRFQKLRTLGQQSPIFLEETESERTSGEPEAADDDCCFGDDESAAFVAEYRQWRRGAPVRAGLPGFSEVKTYGTRREYRAWRAWQLPQERAA